MDSAGAPGDEPIVVVLRSKRRRRMQLVQKFQHALPAALLLLLGVQTLREGAHGAALAIAIVEVLAGSLMIGSVVLTIRRRRRAGSPHGVAGHGHAIDWVDVFAAGVAAAEALERWHARHHVHRPALLMAAVLLGMGLFDGRLFEAIDRRRALRVTADGVSIGRRPIGTFRALWGDIASIELDARWARIRLHSGRERRIDLADAEDPAPARAALEEARRRLEAARATP